MRKAEPLVVACFPFFNEERAMDGVAVRAMRYMNGFEGAVKLGGESAVAWVTDRGFLRYLAFLDFNQPAGFRAA